MTIRSNLAKGALLAATAAMAIGAMPSGASAQAYGGYYGRDGYYSGRQATYDPCVRESTGRTTAGALIGSAVGAAIGSNVAARGVRTEGAVVGGLLGAAVGGSVGQQSAACSPGQTAQPYYGGGNYAPRYDARGGQYQGYESSYPGGYEREYGYESGAYASSAQDECTMAESQIFMPDGRVERRFVRVCMDARGQYQVVD